MNDDALTRSINKGIPVNYMVPVILRYADLQEIFDNDKDFMYGVEQQCGKIFQEVLPDNEALHLHLVKLFEIKTNPETLEREIILSPETLKITLLRCLNCSDSYYDVFNFGVKHEIDKKEGYKRIKVLSKIRTEDDLKKEFPYLYSLASENKKFMKPFLDFKKNIINNPSIPSDVKLRFKAAFWNEFNNGKKLNKNFLSSLDAINSPLYELPPFDSNTIKDALEGELLLEKIEPLAWGVNLKKHVTNLSKSFLWMLENQNYICNEFIKRGFDFSFVNERKQDKLDLYIAFMHIMAAEYPFTVEDKQKHLYYIADYFFHNNNINDTDLSLPLNDIILDDMTSGNITLTPKYLYSRYRKLLIENPGLRVVDSSKFDFSNMSLEDIDVYMKEYLDDLSLSWDFLPPDEFENVPTVPTNGTNGKVLSLEEIERLKKRTLDVFMEKKEFYGSTNPMYRIKGKSTFDGYIGYIYPNGKVVLDKFFDNADKGIISYGNAVYVMNLDEFHELSKQSKTKIISEKLGRRFYHTGDWQERVRKEITDNISLEKESIKKKILFSDILEGSE